MFSGSGWWLMQLFQMNQQTRRTEDSPDEPRFTIDNFGYVIATPPDGGMLRTQSVEAHLLYAILRHLEQKD